ncbi:MAG: ribonuclease E/G [Pseudomonadota bacterium]
MIDTVLVESTPRVVQIALLADGELVEYHVDRRGRGHHEGDVFVCRVTRVVPGLKAAFVDLGNGVSGFLPARDAHREDGATPDINRLVHEGQTVVVAIAKLATAEKGPKVTRRFADHDGAVTHAAARLKPPALVQRSDQRLTRLIDRLDKAHIIVDCPAKYARLRQRVDPERLDYHQGVTPLFAMADIEDQVERALTPTVDLPSGARVVFEPVRTLTAIDVDVASAGERTADPLAVNLEAAAVIARQIRLRNIGGLIVIDFLNMTGEDKAGRLADAMRQAVANDPAQVALVGPSRFGLIEMARERRGDPLAGALGSAVERAADQLVRELRRTAAHGAGTLEVRASPAVVAEFQRGSGGQDVASWIGRRLEVEIESERADHAFLVTAL